MKGRKKRRGTKAEIRAYTKRLQYIATVVTVAILVFLIAFISFLIYSYLKPSSTQPKAAIVDQLSAAPAGGPNPTFIQTATNILETANFTVKYYPGKKVTVDSYRNLPTHGYDIIILRVHSALKSYEEESPVVLFTSERYSPAKYVLEQPDRVGAVAYSIEEAEEEIMYFGITPSFVKHSMRQTFNNTTIVMMGCDGLRYETMAKAFVEKGAKVYISWSGGVSAYHTDLATTQLLRRLITERKTVKQAVTETINEVGPDPADESILLYYPIEAENYVIPETESNLTTNVAQINPETIKFKVIVSPHLLDRY